MTCSFLRAKQPELGLLQQLGVYTLDKNDLLCLHCMPPPLSATGKRIVITEKTLGVPRNSLENHTRHLSIQKTENTTDGSVQSLGHCVCKTKEIATIVLRPPLGYTKRLLMRTQAQL